MTAFVFDSLAALFAVMVLMFLLRADLIGTGRVLSRPLWRFRLCRPLRYGTRVQAGHVRVVQIFVWGAISAPLILTIHSPLIGLVYNVPVTLCYVDDLLTGDDDRWDGLRRRVRRLLDYRPRLRARTPATA